MPSVRKDWAVLAHWRHVVRSMKAEDAEFVYRLLATFIDKIVVHPDEQFEYCGRI